jgi:predicted RNA binding protein YcfA (HicA-like mRNA interferase family)
VARLIPTDWRTLKCVFEQAGFTKEREEASHISMIKPGVLRPVIIPKYDSIGLDIIKSNMRTAGIDRKEYFRLLALC